MRVRTYVGQWKSVILSIILVGFFDVFATGCTTENKPPSAADTLSSSWENDAGIIITTALGEIPEVGFLLAGLTKIFWPDSGEDVWGEIKTKVENLILKEVTKEIDDLINNYALADLGSVQQNDGLYGLLKQFSQVPNLSNLRTANDFFISKQGNFQLKGYEVLLLPLFAQFANLRLAFLREALLLNEKTQFITDPAELKLFKDDLATAIIDYKAWVAQWYPRGLKDIETNKPSIGNVKAYLTQMQTQVLEFAKVWEYFDPIAYPNPTIIKFDPEIFESVAEQTGAYSKESKGNYSIWPYDSNQISPYNYGQNATIQLVSGVQSVQDSSGTSFSSYVLAGVRTTYSSSNVCTIFQNLPIDSPCTNNFSKSADGMTYNGITIHVNPANPIVAVEGDIGIAKQGPDGTTLDPPEPQSIFFLTLTQKDGSIIPFLSRIKQIDPAGDSDPVYQQYLNSGDGSS